MFILAADTAGGATTDVNPGISIIPSLIMIGVMILVFYLILIRPESKRKKKAEAMRNSLQVGDNITTIGGITGTICAVKDKTLVMETGADRVRIEFAKWAVSSKGTQTTEEALPEASEKSEKPDKKEDK